MPDEYFQDLLRLFKGLYSGVQVHGRLGMALAKLLLLIFLKNNLAKKLLWKMARSAFTRYEQCVMSFKPVTVPGG